ncbi:toll/interleukin-1 receptor domain-containing protein [Streptomyces sp. TRM70308]|uniref:toll/interleukin-1 receptor domain-containing protein n=1 Tax=Streptomyces sp. TRM70308 TaxID=3131932 RepID=UPI003D02A42A
MRPKVFISHGAGKDACVREALELIVAALDARDYDVFRDVDSLRAGDDWHPQLFHEMYLCDAAVVLLGPNTVAESDWVRREAEVLMSRYFVRSLRAVLPGFLGGVETRTARERGFGSLVKVHAALSRRAHQPLPEDDGVARVVEWILGEFAPVTAPGGTARRFHDWTLRVARYLETARRESPDALMDAAVALGMNTSERVLLRAKIGAEVYLAHRLLRADTAERLPDAVARLRPGLDPGRLGQLADEVLPVWVDPDAARCFLPPDAPDRKPPDAYAAHEPAEPGAGERPEAGPQPEDADPADAPTGPGPGGLGPVLLFTARDPWTAEQHVRRAVYMAPDSYRLRHLGLTAELPADESTGTEALRAACRTVLREVFDVPPWAPLDSTTVRPRTVHEYLVLSAGQYTLGEIATVTRELHGDFPWLLVVVLLPGGLPEPAELHRHGLAHAVPVRPALTPESELTAYRLGRSLAGAVTTSDSVKVNP